MMGHLAHELSSPYRAMSYRLMDPSCGFVWFPFWHTRPSFEKGADILANNGSGTCADGASFKLCCGIVWRDDTTRCSASQLSSYQNHWLNTIADDHRSFLKAPSYGTLLSYLPQSTR